MSASGGCGRGAIKRGSGLTPQFAGKSVPIRPVLADAYSSSLGSLITAGSRLADWVSRRHRIADEVQPSEKVFGDALDHVGLYNPSDPLTRADLRRFKSTSGSNRE